MIALKINEYYLYIYTYALLLEKIIIYHKFIVVGRYLY